MHPFSATSAIIAATLAATGAGAQGCTPNASGTLYPELGPLALRVSSSARMLGMGDANVAGRDDDVVFYSPAQLAIARGTSASAERFSPGTIAGAVSSVARIGSGAIGLGVSAVQYEAPDCVAAPDLTNFASGGDLHGTSEQLVLGIAQSFRTFRLGVTGKYASEQMNGARFSTAAINVGVSRDISWFDHAPFAAAIAVQDIGADMHPAGSARVHTPLRATVGVAGGAPIGTFDFGMTTAISVRRDGFVAPAGGVEVGYVWIEGYALAARIGARRPEEGLGALTLGAGLQADRISFDYAFESLSVARGAHRIGFRIR